MFGRQNNRGQKPFWETKRKTTSKENKAAAANKASPNPKAWRWWTWGKNAVTNQRQFGDFIYPQPFFWDWREKNTKCWIQKTESEDIDYQSISQKVKNSLGSSKHLQASHLRLRGRPRWRGRLLPWNKMSPPTTQLQATYSYIATCLEG